MVKSPWLATPWWAAVPSSLPLPMMCPNWSVAGKSCWIPAAAFFCLRMVGRKAGRPWKAATINSATGPNPGMPILSGRRVVNTAEGRCSAGNPESRLRRDVASLRPEPGTSIYRNSRYAINSVIRMFRNCASRKEYMGLRLEALKMSRKLVSSPMQTKAILNQMFW